MYSGTSDADDLQWPTIPPWQPVVSHYADHQYPSNDFHRNYCNMFDNDFQSNDDIAVSGGVRNGYAQDILRRGRDADEDELMMSLSLSPIPMLPPPTELSLSIFSHCSQLPSVDVGDNGIELGKAAIDCDEPMCNSNTADNIICSNEYYWTPMARQPWPPNVCGCDASLDYVSYQTAPYIEPNAQPVLQNPAYLKSFDEHGSGSPCSENGEQQRSGYYHTVKRTFDIDDKAQCVAGSNMNVAPNGSASSELIINGLFE